MASCRSDSFAKTKEQIAEQVAALRGAKGDDDIHKKRAQTAAEEKQAQKAAKDERKQAERRGWEAGGAYFAVRLKSQEAATRAGLVWDEKVPKWYAPDTATAAAKAAEVKGVQQLEAPKIKAKAERAYFEVPYSSKDQARAAGLRWDANEKRLVRQRCRDRRQGR
jgi:Domain of unknown function (DUF5710)